MRGVLSAKIVGMNFSQPMADVFVPDGLSPAIALAQVTHLCVAAQSG